MLTGKRKLLAYFSKLDPGVYSVVAVSLCTGFFVGNVISNKVSNPVA